MLGYTGRSLLDSAFLSAAWTRAVYNARNDQVRQLLDSGLSPDQPVSPQHHSPLISIAEIIRPSEVQLARHGETARLLIERGASLFLRDFCGFSPAQHALYSYNRDVASEIVLATLRQGIERGLTPALLPKHAAFFSITPYATYREKLFDNLQRNHDAITHALKRSLVGGDTVFSRMKTEDKKFWLSPALPDYDSLPQPTPALMKQFERAASAMSNLSRDALDNHDIPATVEAEIDRLNQMMWQRVQTLRP